MLTALLWVASEHLASLDRQTFSAVLLVFPAILAAYLLRPGEHAFARRLLVGVRLCGLGVAICSVAISALLGVASLSRERTLVADAVPVGTQSLVCAAENAGVGSGRGRRSELRTLTCQMGARVVEANPATQWWAMRTAAVATVLAAVLLVGLLRTWVWSDLRSRKKTDDYTEIGPERVLVDSSSMKGA